MGKINSYTRLGPIGKSGINWSNGYIYEEFLTELQDSNGIRIYREMSDNDDVIGAILFAIKHILGSVKWTVRTWDGQVSNDDEDVVFLRKNMSGMTHSWQEFITDVLSMLVYGWALFEPIYTLRDGKRCWKSISLRSQSSYDRWEIDERTSVVYGMWQNPAPNYELIYLPFSKCLLFRTELAGDNPMGRSILRNAYRAWYFKKNLEEVEAIGIERDLTGLPFARPPEGFDMNSDGVEEQNAINYTKKLLSNMRRDEQDGIFIPTGWEIGLMASPGARQFDTTPVINRYSKGIALTVLAQFIMLGMERTGSYALAGEFTEMFYNCIEGWINNIANTINRYAVKRLFALNGRVGDDLPKVTHVPSSVRRYRLKDIAAYVKDLTGVEMLDPDDDLRLFLKQYARLERHEEIAK
jgi:hypothetical protein